MTLLRRAVPELSTETAMDVSISRLSALLAEENVALDTMDFARAGGLLAAKHAAAEALAQAWRAADPGLPVGEKMRDLGRLADENRLLLKRAMRVQQRVLDLVAKAARTAPPASRYGAAGKPMVQQISPQNYKTQV